ncbi:AI-2E family transporter [Thermosyntropha sp.]|uniref:AI-2E family transporter n=1 Tax=Thermosyntropha sp. TaxID=2740820 RepID=UPI002600C6C9|nr:AI-2E family transporter [Thermosyntropha sp.]MBO8159814.1 AI-2E family transporter [Thermosyntropha sp.]
MRINIKIWQRYIIFIMVALATIYFLYLVRDVLISFALGALLAYLLFRPVQFIENRGIKRVWAILIIYIVFIFIISLFLYFAVPGIVKELTYLTKILPKYAEETHELVQKIDSIDMPYKLKRVFWENVKQLEDFIYRGINGLIHGVYSLLGSILALVFSPILAFYLMMDWEKIRDNFLSLFSPPVRLEISRLFQEIDEVLIKFIKGYLIVAFIVGLLTGTAAYFMGVKFPLLLGILAGITNLIPFFGAFLGGIPAVLVALSDSFRLGVYMALSIIVIQQLESNFITPNIVGNRLGLHPLVVVFALLAGGSLWGIWGMLVAVPFTAVLRVISGWFYGKIIK